MTCGADRRTDSIGCRYGPVCGDSAVAGALEVGTGCESSRTRAPRVAGGFLKCIGRVGVNGVGFVQEQEESLPFLRGARLKDTAETHRRG